VFLPSYGFLIRIGILSILLKYSNPFLFIQYRSVVLFLNTFFKELYSYQINSVILLLNYFPKIEITAKEF
jgi:hypothetical protein